MKALLGFVSCSHYCVPNTNQYFELTRYNERIIHAIQISCLSPFFASGKPISRLTRSVFSIGTAGRSPLQSKQAELRDRRIWCVNGSRFEKAAR
jgi:hypothetical protein